MEQLIYTFRYAVLPINSSLLTVTLNTLDIMTLFIMTQSIQPPSRRYKWVWLHLDNNLSLCHSFHHNFALSPWKPSNNVVPFEALRINWKKCTSHFCKGVRKLQALEIFKNDNNILFTAILLYTFINSASNLILPFPN